MNEKRSNEKLTGQLTFLLDLMNSTQNKSSISLIGLWLFLDIEHVICSFFAFSLFVSSLIYTSIIHYVLVKSCHPCETAAREEDQGIKGP